MSQARVLPRAAALIAVALAAGIALAQPAAPAAAPRATVPETTAPPAPSALDALLFYQLLIGEIELRGGQPGIAYEVLLDAARRTKDEQLFRRAVDIALQARAGDQALAAAVAWRTAMPDSLEAIRLQVQLLTALNRPSETAEPLRVLLAKTPEIGRPNLIASLPRFFQRTADPKAAAALVEQLLRPYASAPGTRTPVRIAMARAALLAGDAPRALSLAREAQAGEPSAPGPALLGIELMAQQRDAEALVIGYLATPDAENDVRLAYVRALMQAQRYPDAISQLDTATRLKPKDAPPWLTLGALHLELRQPLPAEAALKQYVELVQSGAASASLADDDDDGDGSSPTPPSDTGLVRAWMMLAQAAELRSDFKAAEDYLARVDVPQRALEVQARRAGLLARQGQVREARELIRRVPERTPEDGRGKLVAEAQVLRDVKRWQDAFEVLQAASLRFPTDAELLYEQAMIAEKLDRADEMERLLRRVIELKPDYHHAYNALGYSLADRGQRLPEARDLIRKALDLAPGDPFITDSLGWVEYRLGNRAEALRLLSQAYASRPDAEIAAHLGEVLWVSGQREEALRVWREGRTRDAANDVLRETIARLKPDL